MDRLGQSGGVVIHDFQKSLDRSTSLSDEATWVALYRSVWTSQILQIVGCGKDSVYQRWGVDREIKLVTGQLITIDEKKREKDYGDFLAEEYSVWHSEKDSRNKVGWTLDRSKRCDYVAYAIVPSGECHLLPFDLLRRTARARWSEWKKHPQYPRFAENRGYKTKNCPVPWDRLWSDMRAISQSEFGGKLDLPKAFTVGDQTIFKWDDQ